MRNRRIFNPSADYTKEKNYRNHILEMMNQVQKHRGPDDEGTFLSPQCGLAHVRPESSST